MNWWRFYITFRNWRRSCRLGPRYYDGRKTENPKIKLRRPTFSLFVCGWICRHRNLRIGISDFGSRKLEFGIRILGTRKLESENWIWSKNYEESKLRKEEIGNRETDFWVKQMKTWEIGGNLLTRKIIFKKTTRRDTNQGILFSKLT